MKRSPFLENGVSRKLMLRLPLNVAVGAEARVRKPFKFSVLLSAVNITKCSVRLIGDEGIFERPETSLDVVPTAGVTSVEFTVVPLVRTSNPAWLDIVATGDGLVQRAGFLLRVQ